MGSLGSSSPLSSLPDASSPPKLVAQPSKRALHKDAPVTDVPAKRVRRQSKAKAGAGNKTQDPYNNNPLFQSPQKQPEKSPPTLPNSCPVVTSQKNKNPKISKRKDDLIPQKVSPPATCGLDESQSPPALILPRLLSDSQGSRTLPAHLRVYGPLWEPPALVHLLYNELLHVWETTSKPIELTPSFRKRIQAAEADLLYAPAMPLLCDLGWYKSKWNTEECRENDRWGGWYDHLKLDLDVLIQSQLTDEDVKNYLPVGVQFPAPTMKAVPQDPSRVFQSNLINPWASEADEGSLTLYAGPLTVEKLDGDNQVVKQEQISFQRFSSCCLNRIIPGKNGFLFNAGAPVRSMDFLAASNLTNHSECLDQNGSLAAYDFLALSTISQDPGLLPPAEIMKRLEGDVKSFVQIWSIPHHESTHFSEPPSDEPHSAGSSGQGIHRSANGQSTIADHQNDSAQLEILLAFPSQATAVRWCPRGGSATLNTINYVDSNTSVQHVDSLGLLAVAFLDGVVGLYCVPHPFHAKQLGRAQASPSNYTDRKHVLTLNLAPVATLMLPGTNCLTLEWANHDMLAGGCVNGNIVIWNVETLLQLLSSSSSVQEPLLIRPTHLKPLHAAPVRSISWIRTPPLDPSGKHDINGDPPFLASTGYDGSVKMLDTQDFTASNSFLHERGETTSLAFSSTLGCLNFADSDYSIKAICLRPRELGVSKKLLSQLGLVWQIAISDFHSFIAYAAADGVCGLASAIRPQRYRSRATAWAPKVYQMDFNRLTAQLRMLDNLMPQPRSQDGTATADAKLKAKPVNKKANNARSAQPSETKSQQPAQSVSPIGVYPSVVGVNCLSWNKSLAKGCVLASGMGCGLVRVDYVEGGFNNASTSNRTRSYYDGLLAAAMEMNNPGANMDDIGDD